jgi:hypothetical protein
MRNPVATAALAALVLSAAGCGGGPRGEVAGVVRIDGRPLADALVTFLPDPDEGHKGPRASGRTDAEGKFHLKSEDGRDSVLAGSYRVMVEDLAVYDAPRSPDGTLLSPPARRFPDAYTDAIRTPLRRKVQAGSQTEEIDLKASP